MKNQFNPLENWLNEDPKLKTLLEEITASNDDIIIQARIGFDKISETYSVPRTGQELTEAHYQLSEKNGYDSPTCVSEEVAKIKYVYPKDDPRGIVLMAIYNSLHQYQFEIAKCAKKKFKKAIPKEYTVFFFGEGLDSYLYFPKPGESWVELKAKSMCRIISS